MFPCLLGGAYGDARMPNWPHSHHIPLPGIASLDLHRNKGGMLWGKQPFCPHFSSATEMCWWCNNTLPLFRILGSGVILASRCLWSRPTRIIFFSVARLLTANMGGMVRSGIGCWVAAAMGHLCRSRIISILQPIVKATKAATWFHPSALFSIIRTKLAGVR